MPFLHTWSEEVKSNLAKLEKSDAQRIIHKITWANENNCLLLEKVGGSIDYKYRVGDFRIFFTKIVQGSYLITRLDHRRNAYKKK